MNTFRYDEEKRKQWVRDKFTRAKTVKEICREASISRATLYNWIDEFKYIEEEVKRERESKTPQKAEKSSRLELIQKASYEATERYRMLVSSIASIDTNKSFSKKLVAILIKRFTLTVPQACAIVGIEESVYDYKPRKPEVEDYIVYEALVSLIHEDRTRDFETCYEMLLQRNPDWTRKQIKRVYRDGMVYLERKRANTRWEKNRKEKHQEQRFSKDKMHKPGGVWNLILIEHASYLDGQQQNWWMLCIVDEESNTSLNAMMGFEVIKAEDVLSFLEKAIRENGTPRKLKVPGKPVLTMRELTRWVWQHKMALHTFSLNKPENAEAIEMMEMKVLQDMNITSLHSKEALQKAINKWIARPHVAENA